MAAPEQDPATGISLGKDDPVPGDAPGPGAGPGRHPRRDRLSAAAVHAEYDTGRREETEEEAKRHILLRVARISAGVVVLLLGLAMLALPGPGWLAIALGLGLLAQDVPFAARLLENVRRRLPQDEDGALPKSTIVTMVLIAVVAVAGSVALTIWKDEVLELVGFG